MSLNNVKVLLGVDEDPRLDVIYEQVENRLKNKLSLMIKLEAPFEKVPDELGYIVEEVTIIRFNRLGSEGVSSESLDGHSATYLESDFKLFDDDIVSYVNQYIDPKKGIVRFI